MKGYQLKITIKGSSPPIWRRVIVPEKISFEHLDWIIEDIFGWTYSHLYSFVIPHESRHFDGPPEGGDETAAREGIDRWFFEKAKINYIYDFGDDWEHTILVEKILDYDKRYPQVLKYKGPNMIEDCGGICGFYDVIEEAEPFDMEETNAYLKESMELPVFEGSEEAEVSAGEEDIEEIWQNALKELNRKRRQQKKEKENLPPEPEKSLAEVFASYKKDELIEIARANDFPKPGRFKKTELVQWLKNSLLETLQFRKVLEEADKEEIELFQEAMNEKGTWVDDSLVSTSPLLCFYCGFRENGLLTVPEDVEEKFRKIYDRKFQREQERRWELSGYCRSALYLYGVISLGDLTEIYKGYEHKKVTAEELKDMAFHYPTEMAVKEEYLMEEELEEADLYRHLLENQGSLPYYLPADKEDFLAYGELECQEPDENTRPLLEFLSEDMEQDMPQSMILFYEIQDLIQKNYQPEEIAEIIMELIRETKKSSKKKLIRVIEDTEKYIRTWENRGFTAAELEAMAEEKIRAQASRVLAKPQEELSERNKVIPFPGKKIYPNDPCPCGSGKKYKHCCGKKQK